MGRKQEIVGASLRKLDFLWSKKGARFCDVLKIVFPENFEKDNFPKDISNEEMEQRLKDVYPEDKQDKDK